MYSPKIKTDLVPILFKMAQEQDKPMTSIVDEILRPVLVGYEEQKEIPYCISCYSRLSLDKRSVTAYCNLCKSETFVLYTVPTGIQSLERKEVS